MTILQFWWVAVMADKELVCSISKQPHKGWTFLAFQLPAQEMMFWCIKSSLLLRWSTLLFMVGIAPFPSSFAAAWYFSTPQKKQLVDRHSLWEISLLLMGCALLQTCHIYAHPQKMHCIIRQAIYWCAILLVAACSRSYHFPSLPEVMTNVWH